MTKLVTLEMKSLLLFLLGTMVANAQLAVTVSPPKITGEKAVVPLTMKNHFAEEVESARAAVFLLNEQGKMLGQSTKWVIGGSNTNRLAASATNTYYFVITSDKIFPSTNLTAKVTFNRVVLTGGETANPNTDVRVETAPK